jgi:hypothetical protein
MTKVLPQAREQSVYRGRIGLSKNNGCSTRLAIIPANKSMSLAHAMGDLQGWMRTYLI